MAEPGGKWPRMSATAASDVLDRTMSDEAFLDRFRADPAAALEQYDLTEDEQAALASREESAVRELLGEASLDWQVSVVVVVLSP